MVHTGHIIKLPDNVDTDIIIPTQYMTLETIARMLPHAFSPLRPELPSLVKEGDVLVCGANFGCGSSREQAPEIIKALGIYAVIAKSFARIFFRNAINNGLLVIEHASVHEKAAEGGRISIDLENHVIILGDDEPMDFGRIPDRLIDMMRSGGLVNYYQRLNDRAEQAYGTHDF